MAEETICCEHCGHEYDRHIGSQCPNCGHNNHDLIIEITETNSMHNISDKVTVLKHDGLVSSYFGLDGVIEGYRIEKVGPGTGKATTKHNGIDLVEDWLIRFDEAQLKQSNNSNTCSALWLKRDMFTLK